MKKISFNRFLFILISNVFCFMQLSAQNGTACYKPFAGIGKKATAIQSATICVNCNFINNINKVSDDSTENFATLDLVAGVLTNNGITVKDTISTYPAGWHAGFILDLGNPSLLSANIMSAFKIATYNDDVLQESKTSSNGLAVATVAGISKGRVYLNFKTTLPFDEIRFTFNSTITGLTVFKIYYATAFDPNCGTADVSNACGDQIAGSRTQVIFNGGSVTALSTITNPNFITDGNKRTFATLTLPVGINLTNNPPYIGVLDEQRIYPSGRRAGFVVDYLSSILTADILNSFKLQTYLFGKLQEESVTTGNTLSVKALGVGNNNKSLTFVTTKPFNETRLVFSQTASLNIGTIGINYAFVEPVSCTSCQNILSTLQPVGSVYHATINAARTGIAGTVCVNTSLNGQANVVDGDTTTYATYTLPTAGIGCSMHLSVKLSDTVMRRSFAGFIISKVNGLINSNLLDQTTIRTYRNNVLKNTSTGTALANGSLLSFNSSDKSTVGFKPDSAFDEIEIFVSSLIGLSIGEQLRIYDALVVRDDDGDGVEDCKEVCGMNADDGIDTDGDGTPDACDIEGLETPLNLKVLLQGPLLNTPDSAKDLMRSDLNTGNYIPLQQPYSSSLSPRFAQTGGGGAETVSSTVLAKKFILTDILVDWVLVEIRSSTNPATVIKTVSALVARNGQIVDTLGGPLTISLQPGNYYISVKHRNHLGVMTATAVVMAGSTNSIDFSTLTPAQVYGTNARKPLALSGVYALWAGDVNSDGKVKYQGPGNDSNPVLSKVLQASGNSGYFYNYDSFFGYQQGDIDLSGKTKYQGQLNDVNTILLNVLSHPDNIPGYYYNFDFLLERIPN